MENQKLIITGSPLYLTINYERMLLKADYNTYNKNIVQLLYVCTNVCTNIMLPYIPTKCIVLESAYRPLKKHNSSTESKDWYFKRKALLLLLLSESLRRPNFCTNTMKNSNTFAADFNRRGQQAYPLILISSTETLWLGTTASSWRNKKPVV